MQSEDHWPPSTVEILVLLLGNKSLGTEAVKWGTSALTAGFDAPALRILAGLDLEGSVTTAEVKPLLEAALAQLEIPTFSFEEIARRYLREVAAAIVRGDVEPCLGTDLV